jgi:hypothetical protein
MLRRPIAYLLFLASFAVALPAEACFDGYIARGRHLTLAVSGDSDWEPAHIRRVATWVARIDALLSEEYEDLVRHEDFREIFREVADSVGASSERRARAFRIRVVPVTVQLLAVRNEASALSFAAAIEQTDSADGGFFESGGFPSINPRVHVVSERDRRGRKLYKVLVGAFLERREARKVLYDLEREVGVRGFVRKL